MALRVFLTGGTGLIGRRIIDRLVARGDSPVILSRRAEAVRREPGWQSLEVILGDPTLPGDWEDVVDGCDAVINLAGSNVFGARWSARYKQEIRDSRVHSTEYIVRALGRAAARPRVLVQGSATGFYGPHGDEEQTESSPAGTDFLAKVCVDWENAASRADQLGVRVATIRTGVVLAKGEGALRVMAPVFKWLPGGAAPVGSMGGLFGRGRQWIPWIHLDDIVGIFLLALDNQAAVGPMNGTAPNPVRNVEFSKALAKLLHRPMLPFGPPDLLLRLALGQVAEVVTKGQRVIPARAAQLGYSFQHPDLQEALGAIFPQQGEPQIAG